MNKNNENEKNFCSYIRDELDTFMFDFDEEEQDMTNINENNGLTLNGCPTNITSGNACIDLFFCAGSSRNMSASDINDLVIRSYAENPDLTMKIIFFARDVRGGLGERKFFRTAVDTLVKTAPDSVKKNMQYIAEYGRFDDILPLLSTPLADDAVKFIKAQLDKDIDAMKNGEKVSLLAKWLPSVNTSSAEKNKQGKKLAAKLGMRECQYRKTLSALRRYIDIIENRLRESDYTFKYEIQPSRAMLKYRKAFIRNDKERYTEYINMVNSGEKKINAGCLYPYDIVRACMGYNIPDTEISALDAQWKALPEIGSSANENSLVVLDGSGSMYCNYFAKDGIRPIDAAISLGIYFAERNKGAFANNFITFSMHPKLVEVKGENILDKVKYCMAFNECANTNLEAVFDLILRTAIKRRIAQAEMPEKLYIISDMEFDYCVKGGSDATLYENMKERYAEYGYKLPEIVFWNVNSRSGNLPVTVKDNGTALVSGYTPAIFDLVAGGEISPEKVMYDAVNAERYAPVSA